MRPPVVILGPTGSGKSEVAMGAAQAVPGTEIVVVDAMQLYQGMDIGTAKPSAADRTLVRHHCLDLVEPTAEMSVTEYRAVYDATIDDIARRKNARALIVAGTGLYLTAAIDRLELPGTFPAARAELEADADTADLYRLLAELDPPAAAKIDPGNRRRIIRALEVTIGSGRPFSSYGPGVTAFPPSDIVQLGIRWPRPALADRIAARVDRMLAAGLLEEVTRLADSGMSPTARQALGYKELLDHLDGRVTIDEAIAMIVTRTRQYAARQERWFRRDRRVRWFEIDTDDAHPLAAIRDALVDAVSA